MWPDLGKHAKFTHPIFAIQGFIKSRREVNIDVCTYIASIARYMSLRGTAPRKSIYTILPLCQNSPWASTSIYG